MKPVDETNEEVNTSVDRQAADNEEADSSAQLEENKQKMVNEFSAQGNTAQTQIFIQNLNGAISDLFKNSVSIPSYTQEKKYDLRNKEECTAFVEKYRDSQYLAVAIILSTFEAVALGDLPDLEKQLMDYLPHAETLNNEEKAARSQWDPYISLNTILAVIKGKRFDAKDGRSYTGLGKDSDQALFNILEQFPILRQSIIAWLIHLHEMYQYHTSFDAYQIMKAFARVISVDITDAKARIFPRLCTNPNNAGLLGNLAYQLYGDMTLREDMEEVIGQWLKSDGIWLWKPACMAYAFLAEEDKHFSFEGNLERAIGKRVLYLDGSDLNFLARLLRQYTKLRMMLVRILYNTYNKADTREERLRVAQMYINLVRRSYYQVDSSFVLLPLVACDKKQQQEYLAPIIRQVMSVYRLRKQMYAILKAYMEEISGYKFSMNTINYISAYFYNMASSDLTYRQDVLHFLRNCENKAAMRIYERLCQTYDKKELNLHE